MPRPLLVALGLLLGLSPVASTPAQEPASRSPAPLAAATPGAVRELLEAGRYAEAETSARALLAAVETLATADSLAIADALDVLCESLWRGGKSPDPRSKALAQRAIHIREQRQGPEAAELATSLNSLGNMCRLTADYAQAQRLFERALAIRERTLGPEHARTAGAANNLANVLVDQGELDAAGVMYQRAAEIFQRAVGPEHPNVAQCLGNLAIVKHALGEYAEATQLNERALSIRERSLGPDHPAVGQTLNNLAHVYKNLGDYPRARLLLERALAIQERALGPRHPEVAHGANNLAAVLEEMGDFTTARPLQERALALRESSLGVEHPEYAQSLANLAILTWRAGDVAAALPSFERAVAIVEKALGAQHAQLGRMLLYLAAMRWEASGASGALEASRRALAILELSLGPQHPDVAVALDNLAAVLRETGQPDAALPLLDRALQSARATFGLAHPTVALCARDRARTLLATGDRAAALSAALEAEEAGRSHLRLTTRGLTETQALRFAAARRGGLDLALGMAAHGLSPGERRSVWDAQVRSRAVVLDEMAARHRGALAADDAGIDSLHIQVQRTRTRLANLTVRGAGQLDPVRYRELLEGAAAHAERAERALAQRSATFAAEQARQRFGLNEVLAALPDGGALVAFCQYAASAEGGTGASEAGASQYLAFVGHAGSEVVRAVPLGSGKQIDSAVASWQREAGRVLWRTNADAAERAYFDAGDELRRRVWDPVAPYLEGFDAVFLVPDGALHLVNFAALPTRPGSYLVETRWTHLLSAERDLVQTSSTANRGLLAVGDPDYDRAGRGGLPALLEKAALFRGGRSACASLAELSFDRLPATRKESQAVSGLFRRGRRGELLVELHGSNADEARVKAQMQGKSIVHLATHGFFLGGACATVAPDPTPRRRVDPLDGTVRLPAEPGENPLLLAGLALAGANRRADAAPEAEDGVLTAEEVAALDLRGVEWAVLSACETAAGDVRAGEGVFGLRRAFETAGASTLIMSLWPVEDEAGRAWMTELYRARLKDGLDTANAVRHASLRILQQRRLRGETTHPSVWAGFIAAGGWR